MKKAITLIELIFTIVIIAAVFTTIPKIIYVSNKSLEFSRKEDSIFNMMSKMMDISLKEYDENNTEYDDILLVNNPPQNLALDCNSSSGYRVGGFSGSRNCLNGIEESNVPSNSSGEYDYIEGYNGYTDTLNNGHTTYTLKIDVNYSNEWSGGNYDYDNQELSFNFASTSDDKKNIKRINVSVSDSSGNIISSLSYYSANIGHIKINSVQW